LTSIKDPKALVEYLNQLGLKSDMVMDELKRVSGEKDDYKKKLDAANAEIEAFKKGPEQKAEEVGPKNVDTEEKKDAGHSRNTSGVKSPVSSVLGIFSPKQKPAEEQSKEQGEEFFSYDTELPQLQAEVEAKNEEIAELRSQIENLRKEVDAAKETSSGLKDALEKATREAGDKESAPDTTELQKRLDDKSAELTSLRKQFDESQQQLSRLQTSLAEEKKKFASAGEEHQVALSANVIRHDELAAQLRQVGKDKAVLQDSTAKLDKEVAQLNQEKAQLEAHKSDLEKQLQAKAVSAPPTTPAQTGPATETPNIQAAAVKKKNKKKKKGGAAATAPEAAPTTPEEQADDATNEELEQLKAEIAKKDEQITKLSAQRKTADDLREEIETLQENLLNIGQDHVDAKEKIKALEAENAALKERVAELARELASTAKADTSEKLKKELEELTIKASNLQSDYAAAQQLAQSRYKDLTDLREVLQKAQPELKSLRLESAALKTTREELSAKNAELAGLEKRERDLKSDLARAQRLASDRDGEIKGLREKLAAETSARTKLEDERRVAGRDQRRAEAEKIEISAREENASRELKKIQEESSQLRLRITELEAEVNILRSEEAKLKEDAGLRSSQYGAAQDLLASMRDQTSELGIRLKESQDQAEALEEELAETRKLLGERTREGETMRRLLADVDERADTKIREMRSRLDAAVEERDRFEDEASTGARRKAREAEELRARIRDLEHENRTLSSERDALESQAKDWKRRREELEAVEDKSSAEVAEARSTVLSLRSTLDASEAQVRDTEKQRSELRKALDEYRIRYDKLAKESKALQARLTVGSPSPSGRTSMDSQRSGTPVANGAIAAPDTAYLKTILLQFLEQRDNKLRGQLVPVLGKLLRFDK
jgi:chromosome segregation ATPase